MDGEQPGEPVLVDLAVASDGGGLLIGPLVADLVAVDVHLEVGVELEPDGVALVEGQAVQVVLEPGQVRGLFSHITTGHSQIALGLEEGLPLVELRTSELLNLNAQDHDQAASPAPGYRHALTGHHHALALGRPAWVPEGEQVAVQVLHLALEPQDRLLQAYVQRELQVVALPLPPLVVQH
jgi:hypothetical protein